MILILLFSFQSTFHYDSGYWNDTTEYNLPGGETGFDSQDQVADLLEHVLLQDLSWYQDLQSLMGNTATPHWVVTSRRRWLVHRPPYRPNVIRKGSIFCVLLVPHLKQGWTSLVTSHLTAPVAIHESGLVQGNIMMTPVRVETRQFTWQTMKPNTSKPWATSCCSETKNAWKL